MIRRQFFLSLSQIARYTKLDPSEVVAAIKAGQLPARTFLKQGPGGTVATDYRVSQDDLVTWLRASGRLFDEEGEIAIRPTRRSGPQTTRMLRVACDACGFKFRMAGAWVEATRSALRCLNPQCDRVGRPLSIEDATCDGGDVDVAA